MTSLLARIYETGLTPAQVAAGVHDDGPWRGIPNEEWVERIAHGSTPAREYDEQGRFQPWIRRDPDRQRGVA